MPMGWRGRGTQVVIIHSDRGVHTNHSQPHPKVWPPHPLYFRIFEKYLLPSAVGVLFSTPASVAKPILRSHQTTSMKHTKSSIRDFHILVKCSATKGWLLLILNTAAHRQYQYLCAAWLSRRFLRHFLANFEPKAQNSEESALSIRSFVPNELNNWLRPR